jgi:2-amino-4-hydroxy-6-hydroxymethyldihydropteridine diphosphokinase
LSAEVFIGLGGNLGEVRATFEKALQKLEGFSQVKKVSSLYRSKPYGFEDQPDFLNAAALIATELEPLPLLAELQAIENELGKQVIRENGPRAIDLDLLFYGDLALKTDQLEVPHPGIAERDFVLAPLAELDPDFRHPVLDRSMSQLLSDCSGGYVVETAGEFIPPRAG